MKKIIISSLATLGLVAAIFLLMSFTNLNDTSNAENSSLNFIEIGQTYEVMNGVNGGKATILEKLNGNWVRVRFDRGRGYGGVTNGYLNLETLTFIE